MHTSRKKSFIVKITDTDRAAVRRRQPRAALISIDRRAIVRAAAREVFLETKSTAEALDSIIDGIPHATLYSWMRDHLKKAA